MHYAVIATGGKQYMASLGQSLIIESLPQAEGESVVFEEVLLVVDGSDVLIGQPKVEGVKVAATITEKRRGEKIRVFKYKSKSRYSRTNGHRQDETIVRIDAIGDKKFVAPKAEEKPAVEATVEAPKTEKAKPVAKKATKAQAKETTSKE